MSSHRPTVVAACVVRTDHYGVGMECRINGVAIHFVEHGTDMPLVALHGAGLDHREILMHERPELLAAFFVDWIDRAHPPDK